MTDYYRLGNRQCYELACLLRWHVLSKSLKPSQKTIVLYSQCKCYHTNDSNSKDKLSMPSERETKPFKKKMSQHQVRNYTYNTLMVTLIYCRLELFCTESVRCLCCLLISAKDVYDIYYRCLQYLLQMSMILAGSDIHMIP
mgnify:FL=1